MSLVLQISDPHFGTEQPAVVEALAALESQLLPDVVLLSGDITQRARRSQFDAARRFMQRLRAPVKLAIPGNHDIPLFNLAARLFSPYGNYRRAFGASLEPVFESADLLVIGINSTRPRRQEDGEVSTEQIDRVAERLSRRTPGQLCIVAAHHPVHVTADGDQKNLLHGHRAAVSAWVEAGVDLILGGHIHLPFLRPVRDAVPGLTREAWIVQAGTAVSSRVRSHAPNSVNLIRYSSVAGIRDCAVERWDYVKESAAFARVSLTALMRDDSLAAQIPA